MELLLSRISYLLLLKNKLTSKERSKLKLCEKLKMINVINNV